MFKRTLCAFMALLLLLSLAALAACGGKTPAHPGTDATDEDETDEDETDEDETDEDETDEDETDEDETDEDETDEDETDAPAPAETAVKITQSKAKTVKLGSFDNGLISFQVPEGWMVEVAPVDYIHYSFRAYDPDNMNYMFLFGLKLEGFLKSETARSTYKSLYPDAIFSQLAPIDPQTAEAYFKVWNENAAYANRVDIGYSYFPMLNDFTVIENLGASPLGGDVLRATYKNDAGETNQGLFTASVYDPGSYYIYGVDVFPLNVYNTIIMVAPDDDFVNWQPIYDQCIGSLQFSEAFVNGFNAEEGRLVSTIIANQRVYDSISDMIMDSWEQRSNSYDIISQKRSDATLGYERVYDTETGDIYRAYNGFTDDYSGTRYQTVTDDMYTQGIDGYIEP